MPLVSLLRALAGARGRGPNIPVFVSPRVMLWSSPHK
jgi:hypothetical protein